MAKSFAAELKIFLDAGYPALAVHTTEYSRLEREVMQTKNGRTVFFWNAVDGLQEAETEEKICDGEDPLAVLQKMMTLADETKNGEALVVLRDFHHYFEDPLVLAHLQVVIAHYKRIGSALILVSCVQKLRPEIRSEVTPLSYPLPDVEVLEQSLDGIIEAGKEAYPNVQKIGKDQRHAILQSAKGMTTTEAENAFSKCLVEYGDIHPEAVAKEKMRALEKDGLLQYYEATESMDHVGGLALLKDWLRKRRKAFSEEARKYGLATPRGVLCLGLPGCGKSLTAKALSAAWKLPILRFDVGAVFGSLVGESEENMRRVQERSEALAPVILWIDEIEKAFSGSGGGNLDGGTSERVFGSFLTWLQEKSAEVFVIATANNVSALPPEMLRKGRFDEIFFVDLPNTEEREDILRIHLSKRGRDPKKFDIEKMLKATEGFTGSEIEEAINEAMFSAFDEGGEVEDTHILLATRDIVPLGKLMGEKIDALRKWAAGRARHASKPEKKSGSKPKRKIAGPKVEEN